MPKNYPLYAVIDVETTGFKPNRDEIVEIGIVLLDHDGEHGDWRVSDTFSTLVKPTMKSTNVNNEASRIHGITSRDVQNAPTFKDIAAYIRQFIAGRKLVGHNINRFDAKFLHSAFKRANVTLTLDPDLLTSEWLDTCDLLRKSHSITVPNYKQDTLLRYFGITNQQTHSALGDAQALAQAFMMMMSESQHRQCTYRYYREVVPTTTKTGTLPPNIKPRALAPVRIPVRTPVPETRRPATASTVYTPLPPAPPAPPVPQLTRSSRFVNPYDDPAPTPPMPQQQSVRTYTAPSSTHGFKEWFIPFRTTALSNEAYWQANVLGSVFMLVGMMIFAGLVATERPFLALVVFFSSFLYQTITWGALTARRLVTKGANPNLVLFVFIPFVGVIVVLLLTLMIPHSNRAIAP